MDKGTSDVMARTGQVRPSLWRDRRVLGWAVGEGISSVGDQIWLVAVAYAAVGLGSATLAGTVLACAALPRAVLMLLGGVVTDRVDARKLMLWSNIARILVLAGAIAVFEVAGTSAALLIAVGVLFGVADAFYGPASRALPRQLVSKEDLGRLAGFRQLLIRIALFGGAPLGGLLMAGYGLSAAMLADALSFGVIALVLTQVRPRWPREKAEGKSVLSDLRGGLAYLAQTPRVRSLVIALSGLNVFASPVIVVGVALRSGQQGWHASGLGLLTGAIGAGAGVGTVIAIFWRPVRPVWTALLLLLVQAVALGLVGFGSLAVTLAIMIVVGITAGLASPMLAGAFQAVVGERYLGRTGAVVSITDSGLTPFTLAGFGALAAAFGVGTVSAVFGGAFFLLILAIVAQPGTRALGRDGEPVKPRSLPADR